MQAIFYITGIMYFLVNLGIITSSQKFLVLIPFIIFYLLKNLISFNYNLLLKQSELQKKLNQSPTHAFAKKIGDEIYQSKIQKALKQREMQE